MLAAIAMGVFLHCAAPMPYGQNVAFSLLIGPKGMREDMGGGNVRFLKTVPVQSPRVYAASARLDDMSSTSLMIDDTGLFQQTFLTGTTEPIFVNGRCHR